MLSKKAQYSIYALVKLAKEHGKGPVIINEIAKSEKLPKKFLEVILLDLKNAGFLGSKKGINGGYYLIKEPEDINLADVIRLFDGALALLPCVTFKYYESCNHCKDENTCGLRDAMKDLREITVEFLKRTTIKDLINREQTLLQF